MDHSPITATVTGFCRLSGIGRSRAYEMIADGRIESITLGRSRLIVLDSYHRLVEQQRQEQAASGQRRPSPNPKAPNYMPGGQASSKAPSAPQQQNASGRAGRKRVRRRAVQ
jgi:hypothetical protein